MVEETTNHAEAPRYRDIPLELKEILAAHQEWLSTKGKKGRQAQFKGYDFGGFNLSEVNLPRALLDKANFQGANLTSANFQSAKLCGVNFSQADLLKTNLNDANLQDADLTGAVNLLGGQLAGADLTNARLPEAIAKFESLNNIAEASKNTARVFITMLGACVFSWLTLAITTDAGLLTNTATSSLPVIGTVIPIVYFYVAAPLLLLSIYVYFHINWAGIWEGLAALPALFPDGRRLDQAAYPWLLNGLVCRYFHCLQSQRPAFSLLQFFLSLLLAWGFVPLTLLALWLRSLPRQDWPLTLWLLALAALSCGFWLRSFLLARALLRRRDYQYYYPNLKSALIASFMGFFLFSVSLGSIYGVPEKNVVYKVCFTHSIIQDAVPDVDPDFSFFQIPIFLKKLRLPDFTLEAPWLRHAIPCIFDYLGLSPFPFTNLTETNVSTKPPNWTGQKEKEKQELLLVKGAQLHRHSLRFAEGRRSFLVAADLREADLRGAMLVGTDLRLAQMQSAHLQFAKLKEANLEEANLQRANLGLADLSKANLRGANLEWAHILRGNLDVANLQGAILENAYLRKAYLHGACLLGANLKYANLQEVYFWEANLQEANLDGASLIGANLKGANLQGASLAMYQVHDARCWPLAQYSPEMLKVLQLPPEHNENLKRENFGGYQLAGANLQDIDLVGFNLDGANLQRANLQRANLQGANLYGTNLREANLQDAAFFEARSLMKDQVLAARCWPLAKYSPEMLKVLQLPPGHNENLKRHNLRGYQLAGANLQDANLVGFNLDGANLQGANLQGACLREANLQGANLTKANLQGADLQGSRGDQRPEWEDLQGADRKDHQGADLRGAVGLTGEQIKSAHIDKTTRLPDYLSKP